MASELIRDQFEIIAYRGGAGERPENTMAAFSHAVDLSPEIVLDLDLQLAKDQTIMVFHDATLDRTTNGAGNISDFTLAELKQFDAGFHFLNQANEHSFRDQGIKIPTLEEVLTEFSASRLILDLRRDEADHIMNVINLVERLHAAERVIIVSESDQTINTVRTQRPNWIYGAPTNEARMVVFNAMPPVSAIFMLPEKHDHIEVVNGRLIEELHKWDRKLWVWTIDAPNDFARLKNLGIDGIFTNYPERIITYK